MKSSRRIERASISGTTVAKTAATIFAASASSMSNPPKQLTALGTEVFPVRKVAQVGAVFLALLVAGCGPSAAEQAASKQRAVAAKKKREQAAEFKECRAAFADLLDSLSSVNSDLSVGLNVGDYGSVVRRANRDYGDLMNSGELGGVDCLTKVGIPAEKAVNNHIKAFNLWNECVSDFGCSDDSIDSKRQQLWRKASNSTDKAIEHLAGMNPN